VIVNINFSQTHRNRNRLIGLAAELLHGGQYLVNQTIYALHIKLTLCRDWASYVPASAMRWRGYVA